MPFGIYKRDQGLWARGIGSTGLIALGIWGAVELQRDLSNHPYGSYIAAGVTFLAFLVAAYVICNLPTSTEFLIETETEMRKVTWPSTREVIGATVVVIVVVIVLGIYLFCIDRLAIQPFFQYVLKILPK
jgi:preprotein translocase SecE subunit